MKRLSLTLTAATVALAAPFVDAPQAQAAAFNDASLPVFSELTIDTITAKVTKGINLTDDSTGSLGAFSDFYYSDGVTTLDFNSAPQAVAGQENAYTFGDDSMVFTFDKEMGKNGSKVRSDRWAPSGANGERNESDYLSIFPGNALTIDLENSLNYFGMNWGALSRNNTFEFFQVDDSGSETSLGMFNYDKLFSQSGDSVLPTLAEHQNEYNGYVHFYANDAGGLFNRIRVSQVDRDGGGFETDNYSFRVSDRSFDFETGQDATDVPEPSVLLGLGAVVAGLAARRRKSLAAM
ncbi:PEP-CTERM sorting domain-containing protein [cf. Phormidesmis sp. LEGE 11477]|uniref:PEP-CTERM sorting domain-containing protein n=1 Tax=cf. Phormidesmis sp. LEGE 11477 TaxID=1828680 RepID=UPI00187E4032|nr:PEP-CTERM sorting domain-containing protein [cf. Phormidesmis sp. LEGE 11477]MBE9060795.1 PEP-CTERM sorting domain-containing protein [cf. Phormidesmis sp. LEGE 11477]